MSLDQYLFNNNCRDLEGNVGSFSEKSKDLIQLTNKPYLNVMEIGFNAGHSADIFLRNNENLQLTSFDIGDHDYVSVSKKYIDMLYPGRHLLIVGDSTKNVTTFAQLYNTRFDVIFIDGGHSYEVAMADLQNSMLLAHKDTIVIMDDIIYTPGNERDYSIGPTKAWSDMIYSNKIIELGHREYSPKEYGPDGLAWGKYIFE